MKKCINKSILLKASALLLTLTVLFNINIHAQCLTNQLNISTGISGGTPLSTNYLSDPFWTISNTTGPQAAAPYIQGQNATVVPHHASQWHDPVASGTNARWISVNKNTRDGVIITPGDETTVFNREFRICEQGDFILEIWLLNDNYCPEIKIDNVVVLQPQTTPTNSTNNYGPFWGVGLTSSLTPITLTPGIHSISVTVNNNDNPQSIANPTGLLIEGMLIEANGVQAIVDDQNPSCENYVCENGCNDDCYWRVEGNHINLDQSGNPINLLGTLSDHSINIITNTHNRGIVTQGGAGHTDKTAGRLGWNTMSPTARLHIDCLDGNDPSDPDPQFQHSDIRFENLEFGEGNILAIDGQGYVYRTTFPADNLVGGGEMMRQLEKEKAKTEKLQQQLTALESRLVALENSTTYNTDKTVDHNSNILYQNTPNPFGSETEIRYEINKMQQSAYIIVYELNGRELMKYHVKEGAGSIKINSKKLVPGMYMYALVIDGKPEDSKRMVFSD